MNARTPAGLGRRLSNAGWFLLVAALFCAPLFVGLGRADMENDEAIYSYAVQSILETGDWLNPRSSPDPNAIFLEKPPLKIWIVALPIRAGILPNDEFGLRFWDAVFGSAVFLYVFALGKRLAGPFCGLVAALALFAFSPLIFEHGLRSNNMEAALTLAYCGGMYHYLRWAEPERTTDEAAANRPGWMQPLAVGGYCLLGFMTKFAAIVFLPVALIVASLAIPDVRRRLLVHWRTWLAVAGLALALAAPWFLYQSMQGRAIWTVIFEEHLVRRMTSSLDPAHVHAWNFYFVYLFAILRAAGASSIVLIGSAFLLVQTVRTRSIAGTFVLAWFLVPVGLMSLGTSKLGHYLYPYLPPVALAAGFLMATILHLPDRVAWRRWASWPADRFARLGRWRAVAASMQRAAEALSMRWGRWLFAGLRATLAVMAAAWLALAIVALVHPGRVQVAGITIARNPIPLRLAFNAAVAGLVAGYGRRARRMALPVLLIALSPVAAYRSNLPRLVVQEHPRRAARDCLLAARDDERQAGRATPPVLVHEPSDFTHPDFFYLRSLGWEWRDALSEEEFRSLVGTEGARRLVLLPRATFERLWQPYAAAGWRAPERAAFRSVLLLLPSPFAACGE